MTNADNEKFNEDYFLRGKEKGISNFENYSWKADATVAMVVHLKRYLGITEKDSVLDVGCATGNYVRALRMLGVDAYGFDVSKWAVENSDPVVRPYLSNFLNGAQWDIAYAKDSLEHIPEDQLRSFLTNFLRQVKRRFFAIVPLAKETGGEYVHPKEENDKTHVNRWTLNDWMAFLQSCSTAFVVNGSYLYPGLKPGAYEVQNGYGFLLMERI